ncbi:MAG: hemerythrin family protein [Lachnospiraceae bacterium]|nr:hemerythrin family protein [Lachnospiraceae bacterium]
MYQFTEDCLIGVEQIDNEHRRLFELVNETADLLMKDTVNRNDVTKLFTELNEYAVLHFRHEEEYMQEVNDPELPRQKEMHQAFVSKLKEIELGDIKSTDDKETVKNILEFVARWLFSHILSSDTMIGVFQKMDAKNEETKDPFAFTDEYRTGIEIVDEEHEELFHIIRRANDLITEELLHDKYDEIMSVLDELRNYTIKHFADEEEYMVSINYNGLDAQKKTHEMFVDKLNDINLDDLDDNQQQYLIELVDFLLMWLVNHILKMDKKIPRK